MFKQSGIYWIAFALHLLFRLFRRGIPENFLPACRPLPLRALFPRHWHCWEMRQLLFGEGYGIMGAEGVEMPVISRFYGLSVKMYFKGSEHNPPHIHVLYGEYMGAINIKTQELIEGDLPSKALALAAEWTKKHEAELMEAWNTQKIKELPPLE
jgi:hypothetical protein